MDKNNYLQKLLSNFIAVHSPIQQHQQWSRVYKYDEKMELMFIFKFYLLLYRFLNNCEKTK